MPRTGRTFTSSGSASASAMTSAVEIETLRSARLKRGHMDAATAAKVKPGDILPYPEGWPRTGPNTLVEPCEVFAARDCPFSESGRILYLHGVSGKTIELDASWFLPPARLKPPETVVFVSNEETKKQASEWEF